MIKNFTETVRFTAESFLEPGSIDKKTTALIKEYSLKKFENNEEKENFRSKIEKSLNPNTQQMLASVGAKVPFDPVDVSLEFSSFLFDVYEIGSIKPQAPLAAAAHNKRLQNLAERLESGNFNLTPEELSVIRKVLESDENWKNVKFNCFIETKKEDGSTQKMAIVLTTHGIQFYNKTLTAAVQLFEANNEDTGTNNKTVPTEQVS